MVFLRLDYKTPWKIICTGNDYFPGKTKVLFVFCCPQYLCSPIRYIEVLQDILLRHAEMRTLNNSNRDLKQKYNKKVASISSKAAKRDKA